MQLPSDRITRVRALFSDIDGTIVHYESTLQRQGYSLSGPAVGDGGNTTFLHEATDTSIPVKKVPSLTLGGGYISLRTLELVKELRANGVIYCLLTGARTSTYRMRQDTQAVPTCDFGVCEGGGKLWRLCEQHGREEYVLDKQWMARFARITGEASANDAHEDPRDRTGPLWDCYRALVHAGLKLDAKSFSTSFLVDLRGGGKGFDVVEADERRVKLLFSEEFTHKWGVDIVTNLGKGQVHPVGCNKRAAVEYILATTGISPQEAVAMGDDENDLDFMSACSCGFITGIAHPSVEEAASRQPGVLFRHRHDGFLATEAALEAVLTLARESPGH